MRRLVLYIVVFVALVTLTNRCVEPYEADIPLREVKILVIDGYINAGPGKSSFRISKATPVNQMPVFSYESGALVSIETNTNESFLLTENGNGIYTSGELGLSVEGTYRLHVKLKNGNEYRSGFLPVKITPVIDSISWEWLPDNLYLFVNSHDLARQTRYYQWEYQEDWQIQSPELSLLKYENDTIVSRPTEEIDAMFNCWGTAKSKGLIFGSTEALTIDAIKFPILKIPHGAERTSVRYSILVRQHTIGQDEFEYMQLLEKNSTQVGSFFDPMPAQLYGNITSVNNPGELVIGFVGAYTTETKRIYINNQDLPPVPVEISCANDVVDFVFNPDSLQQHFGSGQYTPTAIYVDPFTRTLRVSGMSSYCFDCRLRGSSTKPAFWE